MEANELKTLLEDNHKLLQKNNLLLREIIKQNHLIFTITQENTRYYSNQWFWRESGKVKSLREELNALHKKLTEELP